LDVQERLDELAVLIEDAKAMPLSASCLVNRAQVLDLIDELETTAAEDQQIALSIVRQLECYHDDIVAKMQEDADAKHNQIVAWAVDADRLMQSRIVLESVDLS